MAFIEAADPIPMAKLLLSCIYSHIDACRAITIQSGLVHLYDCIHNSDYSIVRIQFIKPKSILRKMPKHFLPRIWIKKWDHQVCMILMVSNIENQRGNSVICKIPYDGQIIEVFDCVGRKRTELKRADLDMEIFRHLKLKKSDKCGNPDCKVVARRCMKCSKCLKVSYCSRECQESQWKIHKKNCLAILPTDQLD